MPRRRTRIPIAGTGRPYHATPRELRDLGRQGRVIRGDDGRWRFCRLFRAALNAAKGRVHRRATKPGWNGSVTSGGGIFRSRPRLEPDPEQSKYDNEIRRARPDDTGTEDAACNAVYHV